MHTPFTLWLNFSHVQMIVLLTIWLCKCVLHCNIFIVCMFMTCSTSYCLVILKDLWNVCMCTVWNQTAYSRDTTVLFEMYESFLIILDYNVSVCGPYSGLVTRILLFFLSGTYSLPTGIACPSQLSHLILHLLMDMVAMSLPFNLLRPYM